MRIDRLTLDLVKSRFLYILSNENSPRSHIINAGYNLAVRDGSDVSVRKVLRAAGYATSIFYKYWPGRSNFIIDGYLYCVEKYIDAEIAFAREFSGDTPKEFFALVAFHTVLSQKHIHRDFFREIAGKMAGGDYSRLLVHMESQVRRNMEVFIEKFPDYKEEIDFSSGLGMMWAVGTFILNRNYDAGLEVVTDEELVNMIVDAYAGLLRKPI